jgi:hypothetical protein
MENDSKPGFTIATRQKADLLFGPLPNRLASGGSIILPVRDVSGYVRVNFLAISAQPFTLLVEEACLPDGTFIQAESFASVTDAVSGMQVVCEQVFPCGSFMRVTVTNTGTAAAVSLCGSGLPHGAGAGGGTNGGRDISARITNNVDQSIPDTTPTNIAFDTEIYDTDAMFDPAFPTVLAIRRSGKYDLQASLTWGAGGGTDRLIVIMKNGGPTVANGNITPIVGSLTSQEVNGAGIPLVAGDFLEVLVFHDAGAPLLVLTGGDVTPIFYAKKVN